MGGGTPNYNRIQGMTTDLRAKRYRDKILEGNDKFPHCRGTFDTCPTEEELKIALDKKMAPERCGRCPVYDASGRPLPVISNKKMTPEDEEFLKKTFEK